MEPVDAYVFMVTNGLSFFSTDLNSNGPRDILLKAEKDPGKKLWSCENCGRLIKPRQNFCTRKCREEYLEGWEVIR